MPAPARLELELAYDGARTRPVRALAIPPLQLSRARYDHAAPQRLSMTILQLGGMLAGDQTDLTVTLGPHADAHLVAAAATQVYSMPDVPASQQSLIRTAPGSRLIWQPGPLILFAQAQFCQHTRIELAPGALIILFESLVAGRLAHGERWRFSSHTSHFEVCGPGGQLLAAERLLIEPERRSPDAPGAMADFAALGSLWILGDGFDHSRAAALIGAQQHQSSAVVLPGQAGILVRTLGPHLGMVQQHLLNHYTTLVAAGCVPADGDGIHSGQPTL